MRICVVTTKTRAHGLGGVEDHVHELVRGLVVIGHEVEVISSRHPTGVTEEVLDGARWRYLDAPGHHLDRNWLQVSHTAFERLHAERGFDVIHSQSSAGLGLVRKGVHRRVPMVVMFHGNFLGHARQGLARALRARPRAALSELRGLFDLAVRRHFRLGNSYRFRPCDAIVPSKQQARDTARSHLLRRTRVHVVPNGVDTSLFRPRPGEDIRSRRALGPEPLLLCVGRLAGAKGTDDSIRALAAMPELAVPPRLVIVGDGPDRAGLERLTAECGVAERVTFAGAVPPATVAELLAAADVFLFPSRYAEAAPLVLLQAMASGCAIVASDLGAMPEIAGRSSGGALFVRAGDIEGIAAAVSRILGDEDLRSSLGEAARARALTEFTLELMVERTLDVYDVARHRLAGPSGRALEGRPPQAAPSDGA